MAAIIFYVALTSILLLTIYYVTKEIVKDIKRERQESKNKDEKYRLVKELVDSTIKKVGLVDICIHSDGHETWSTSNGVKIHGVKLDCSTDARKIFSEMGFHGYEWDKYYKENKWINCIELRRPIETIIKEILRGEIYHVQMYGSENVFNIVAQGINGNNLFKYRIEDYRRGADISSKSRIVALSIKEDFDLISGPSLFSPYSYTFKRKPK